MNIDCRMCKLDDEGDPLKDKKEVVGKGDRMFTDPCCLLLFISMIIVDISLFFYAKSEGANIEYLYHGHDYDGNICNSSMNIKAAWFSTDSALIDITRCVAGCSFDVIGTYVAQEFEDRWCVPSTSQYKALYETNEFDFERGSATYARTVADLITQFSIIAVICFASILVSVIYLLFIQLNLRLLAYIIMNIIFGIIAAGILMHHGLKDFANELTDDTGVIEIAEGAVILFFVLMITIYFIVDRKALLTDIEMLAEAKQVRTIFFLCTFETEYTQYPSLNFTFFHYMV